MARITTTSTTTSGPAKNLVPSFKATPRFMRVLQLAGLSCCLPLSTQGGYSVTNVWETPLPEGLCMSGGPLPEGLCMSGGPCLRASVCQGDLAWGPLYVRGTLPEGLCMSGGPCLRASVCQGSHCLRAFVCQGGHCLRAFVCLRDQSFMRPSIAYVWGATAEGPF